ncbi:MAG: hypothetical protein ISS53_01060 [Dehalococcoidia bacterium]|nr:hypothetical protein [Dehalococcoidia bacterium]
MIPTDEEIDRTIRGQTVGCIIMVVLAIIFIAGIVLGWWHQILFGGGGGGSGVPEPWGPNPVNP